MSTHEIAMMLPSGPTLRPQATRAMRASARTGKRVISQGFSSEIVMAIIALRIGYAAVRALMAPVHHRVQRGDTIRGPVFTCGPPPAGEHREAAGS